MQWVKCLIAILSLMSSAGWADRVNQDRFYTVPSEFWERPRTGKAVLEQPALRQSVSALLSKSSATLMIHHSNDEEALLRAEELRAWLMALAVEATWIGVTGDLPGSAELQIELR